MKSLKIGDMIAKFPIIQGGMGVGISRSNLAGAVAKEGGVGIISTAQIGYDEENFEKNQAEANLAAIDKHIKKAKEIAGGNGLVGVNVMVALKHFKDHVVQSVKSGADVVICGAGLPMDLPEIVKSVKGATTKIAPIVSSERAAKLILKMWDHKYKSTADFIVIEGPRAGGHLGFRPEDLEHIEEIDMDSEISKIIECKHAYEEKYGHNIPVIVGGGVFDSEDIKHVIELGADGVQIASRFVATYECDAAQCYKDAYINAKKSDITIVKSPVGMPGRAINNEFIKKVAEGKQPITKCYQCLDKCNPAAVPYCITKALTEAVKGHLSDGLIFCGDNTDRIDKMMSVHDLMQELVVE